MHQGFSGTTGSCRLLVSNGNVAEIPNPDQTKRMLIRIVGQYAPHTPDCDMALFYLRGAPRDYVHLFVVHWIVNCFLDL